MIDDVILLEVIPDRQVDCEEMIALFEMFCSSADTPALVIDLSRVDVVTSDFMADS